MVATVRRVIDGGKASDSGSTRDAELEVCLENRKLPLM
jgi:hypothetical protein